MESAAGEYAAVTETNKGVGITVEMMNFSALEINGFNLYRVGAFCPVERVDGHSDAAIVRGSDCTNEWNFGHV
ncbi:hypothetical protein D3C78_1795370 [compost metagenome]